MGLVFVFKVDTSKVSWSLTGSHGSMTARVKSWGVGKLSEYLRDRSASRVLAPRWVWSSWSLGHPRHGSQYVTVWSCAVPMWRFCCLRCELEWSGRQTSTANALPRHWRRGQVQVATVCGPVWKLGSQKKSWFQMVSVSDGLARFGSVRICRTGQAACPDFGTVEFGVVCDGFGRLSFFVLQCWEEIWRGLGGFALFSVCFVCSRSAEASYKRWLCPFVSPDPKWEAFRGQRVPRASCLTRRRVLLGWFFIQVFATRLCLCYSDSILLFMLFWGSWCFRLPSFLMCFDTREMWSVAYALRIYALLALRFQLPIQLFRHGLGEVFCHGQINLKPIKFQRESLKTMEGHDVSEYWSQDFDWAIFRWSGCFHQTIFQAARTAAQLRFPVQAAVVIPQNHWIAGGHIVRRQ